MDVKARIGLLVQAQGAKRTASDIEGVAHSVDDLGTKSTRSGRAARRSSAEHDRFHRSIRGLSSALKIGAVGAVGAAASYLGIGAAKSAIDTTIGLGKATVALHRNLGLSNKVASEWAASAVARGVDTDSLSTSFTSLSKNVRAAMGGSKTAQGAFRSLGLSQAEVARGSKDFNWLLGRVADSFGGMQGGAERAALAQTLLGRSSQTTLPIFTAGRKSMQENLRLADKYGVTLGGNPLKSTRDLARAQREMQFASLGLQVQFATRLAPTLIKVMGAFSSLFIAIRDGRGPFRILGAVIGGTAKTIGALYNFLAKHKTTANVLTVGVIGLTAALVTYNAIAWVAAARTKLLTVWETALAARSAIAAGASTLLTGAIGLLNTVLLVNPIVAVAVAIAALTVGFVVLYRRSVGFRNFVNRWWPVIAVVVRGLLGPLYAVSFAFGMILTHARGVTRGVRATFNGVVGFIRGLPGRIAGAASGMWNGVKAGLSSAIQWIKDQWNALADKLTVNIGGQSLGSFAGHSLGHLPKTHISVLPHIATGGLIARGGAAVVGEDGPEVVTLPRGATVHPNGAAAPTIQPRALAQIGGDRPVEIHVHSHLDGREVAHSVRRASLQALLKASPA